MPRLRPEALQRAARGAFLQQRQAAVIGAQSSSLKILEESSPGATGAWMLGGEGLWTRPRTALAAAVALHPQLPSPATFPLGHRQKDLYSIIYIFHYEIAISFPAFYLIHPELNASF